MRACIWEKQDNSGKPGGSGCCFTDIILKYIFLNKNHFIDANFTETCSIIIVDNQYGFG